jgi:tetratricopeptide (TPR) repeat protein
MWNSRFSLASVALVFAALIAPLFAQSPSPAAKPDYSRDAAVIEKYSNVIAYENDGTGSRVQSAKIRIQSDAGVQRFGLLVFPYASSVESLTIDYVRVHKSDGTVVSTPPEDIQDVTSDITRAAPFYSDLREKHVAVRGLSTGDLLEYQIHWQITKPLAPGQFWYAQEFDDNEIVLQETLQISVPANRAVKWASPKLKPVIVEAGGRKTFTWTTSNLKIKSEDDQPDRSLEISTGTLDPPDVQLSSFQNWNQVAQWYGSLQKERVRPSPAVAAKAAELTRGLTDENAKIQKLYDYVSTQLRYIGIAFGIGRYQPHSADDILNNAYGDCKDKHTLLAAMLQSIGVTAYPALINSSRKVDPDVPSPAQFDHVITAVPQGKNFLWLDTTTEVGPFGYLVPPLRNKPALVVESNALSTFVTTVAEPPSPNLEKFQITGTLSDADVLDAKVTYSMRGDSEVVFRAVFRMVPESKWKDLVQNIAYRLGFGGTVSDVSATAPDDFDFPFQFSYTYNRNNYPDWDNKRISPPFPIFTFPSLKDDQTKFTAPLWLGAPKVEIFEARIQMPSKYPIQQMPSDVNLVNDFADYHSSFKNDHGTLVMERRIIVKEDAVPIDEFDKYKSFLKSFQDDLNESATLSTPGNTSANQNTPKVLFNPFAEMQKITGELAVSSNPEAIRLVSEATDALKHRDLATALVSLKSAVATDPKYTFAWNLLGSLLLESKQTDAALDAFQHEIAVDPSQVAPYQAAIMALMLRAEYDKAIPILQQLVRLAPNDHDAIENLALANFQAKHYAAAVSAYQAAIKLDGKNAGLRVSLGDAYLLQGDTAKAFDAFNTALQMNSAPVMLNNIAYEMSEAKKALPQALDYAQKAVQQEEEATAALDLSTLKDQDLGYVSSLSAFWDTLGWVYFQMGNFTEAEKYLYAAWLLTPSSVQSDHLGQVYEAEHKNKDAIRMYKLALGWDATFNVPDDATKDLRQRLEHLDPKSSQPSVHNFTNPMGDEDSKLRTVKLPEITSHTASAEFFLIFSQDPKTSLAKVEQVKFISGADELKSATKQLEKAHYDVSFPDNGPTRLVRRGILGCYQYSGCSFVLYSPGMVRSVN